MKVKSTVSGGGHVWIPPRRLDCESDPSGAGAPGRDGGGAGPSAAGRSQNNKRRCVSSCLPVSFVISVCISVCLFASLSLSLWMPTMIRSLKRLYPSYSGDVFYLNTINSLDELTPAWYTEVSSTVDTEYAPWLE